MKIDFKNKKIAIILIVALFIIVLFGVFNNKFGSPFYYIDALLHPQKYSYNYFMANCTIQDDFARTDNSSDTVYNDLIKQYKKHKNNEINLKIINSGFDVYYAILSNNYKNIKPVKLNENWSKDILGTMSFVNIFVPKNESIVQIYKSIYEKQRIIKLVNRYFKNQDVKAKADIRNVKFYNPMYDDKYFINMVNDMQTVEQNQDVKEKAAAMNKLNPGKNSAADFVNATQSYMQALYLHFNHQYIIEYKGKNGNKYFVKVKPVPYGNIEHWNYMVEEANNEDLNELIGEFAQRMLKVYMKNKLSNFF